eukprot:TRINITY_DN1002_c0_g1_i1.p1 TRINITY_DN1002_c0_g1~~TRINITY_DN1002_c0_g1_i1.p1  ORF type:complete len:497 (-),score=115.67 TRINITY_DN1002_c0_g1_i1:870-2360(-)
MNPASANAGLPQQFQYSFQTFQNPGFPTMPSIFPSPQMGNTFPMVNIMASVPMNPFMGMNQSPLQQPFTGFPAPTPILQNSFQAPFQNAFSSQLSTFQPQMNHGFPMMQTPQNSFHFQPPPSYSQQNNNNDIPPPYVGPETNPFAASAQANPFGETKSAPSNPFVEVKNELPNPFEQKIHEEQIAYRERMMETKKKPLMYVFWDADVCPPHELQVDFRTTMLEFAQMHNCLLQSVEAYCSSAVLQANAHLLKGITTFQTDAASHARAGVMTRLLDLVLELRQQNEPTPFKFVLIVGTDDWSSSITTMVNRQIPVIVIHKDLQHFRPLIDVLYPWSDLVNGDLQMMFLNHQRSIYEKEEENRRKSLARDDRKKHKRIDEVILDPKIQSKQRFNTSQKSNREAKKENSRSTMFHNVVRMVGKGVDTGNHMDGKVSLEFLDRRLIGKALEFGFRSVLDFVQRAQLEGVVECEMDSQGQYWVWVPRANVETKEEVGSEDK